LALGCQESLCVLPVSYWITQTLGHVGETNLGLLTLSWEIQPKHMHHILTYVVSLSAKCPQHTVLVCIADMMHPLSTMQQSSN